MFTITSLNNGIKTEIRRPRGNGYAKHKGQRRVVSVTARSRARGRTSILT
jgi:hypothetical protein